MIEEFVEKGAALEHARWSRWMEYFLGKCKVTEEDEKIILVLDKAHYDRWKRQISTDYADLSEEEKESDRKEVREYLALVDELLKEKSTESIKTERRRILTLLEHYTVVASEDVRAATLTKDQFYSIVLAKENSNYL